MRRGYLFYGGLSIIARRLYNATYKVLPEVLSTSVLPYLRRYTEVIQPPLVASVCVYTHELVEDRYSAFDIRILIRYDLLVSYVFASS